MTIRPSGVLKSTILPRENAVKALDSCYDRGDTRVVLGSLLEDLYASSSPATGFRAMCEALYQQQPGTVPWTRHQERIGGI